MNGAGGWGGGRYTFVHTAERPLPQYGPYLHALQPVLQPHAQQAHSQGAAQHCARGNPKRASALHCARRNPKRASALHCSSQVGSSNQDRVRMCRCPRLVSVDACTRWMHPVARLQHMRVCSCVQSQFLATGRRRAKHLCAKLRHGTAMSHRGSIQQIEIQPEGGWSESVSERREERALAALNSG